MVLGNVASLLGFAPELALSAGVLVILTVSLLRRRPSKPLAAALALATLVASVGATLATRARVDAGDAGGVLGLFGGLVVRDAFGDFFRVAFAVAGAVVVLAGLRSPEIDAPTGAGSDEFPALVLTVVLGADLMAASANLLSIYLAVELVSVISYVLAGYARRSRPAAEAALKYAIYGGVASAVMLYGFSLLYGLAASADLSALAPALASAPPLAVALMLALVLAGLGFKMALAPFHMWCPDVYEGAPGPVVTLFSVVPKAAGFALAWRFVTAALPESVLPTVGPATPVTLALLLVAVVTMTLGNLTALSQRNVRRLLAYSSIAHAGTMVLALAVRSDAAGQALLIYLGVYVFMTLVAFLTLVALAARGVGAGLDDLAGLGRRAPVVAFCFAVALFSLTGLPPLGGFVAKYALFAAVVRRGLDGGGAPFFLAATVAVLNTVVSLGYYARVVKVMYFDQPSRVLAARVAPLHVGLLAVLTASVIMLGVYATPLTVLVGESVVGGSVQRSAAVTGFARP